jgi:hypothetical protein
VHSFLIRLRAIEIRHTALMTARARRIGKADTLSLTKHHIPLMVIDLGDRLIFGAVGSTP